MTITMNIIDLPRSHWRYLPPRKWQVITAVAGIVATSLLWGVFC